MDADVWEFALRFVKCAAIVAAIVIAGIAFFIGRGCS